jgi:3-oxoacyl-[acyl-carrier protein] reductase
MIALVTGGSRGLGYHIASGLGAAGFRVAVTARESSALYAAAGEIGALALAADVTSPAAVERVVAQVEEDLARSLCL